ncbi:MAG: DNA repair protein RecN [Oscillospiraceae bacterium]|jgi:DNA repair protein RecN (Recombination protein N)|nr:DNA repair protein RecN [Oscillospiraceae bacterium]
MLKELYIENLAVIEQTSVTFGSGLTVFTGETGAGKSILIGGIKAILGGRVSKDLVRSGAEKAVITALFDVHGESGEEELLLTREISSTGTSVAKINGKPVTAADLRKAAAELIDIHGQHDSRTLTDNIHQRELLDNFGRLTADLEAYAVVFKSFSELSRRIKKLQIDENIKAEKTALLKDKIEDVNSYKLTLGEETEVSQKLTAARNSKAIKQGLGIIRECLSTDSVREARGILKEIAEFLPDGDEILKRVESLAIELDDVRGEIAALDSDGSDSAQTARLEERMSDLLRLKRKYKLDIDELIAEHESWRDELAELEYSEDMTEKLLTERKDTGDNLKRLAGEITEKRKKAASELAVKITEELTELDMPNVRLFFDVRQEKVTVSGMDSVEIMISVNKGEEPKPLAKIASGGELSRIMLAIKAVLAETDSVPTMIFDEIDTGISGRAAQKVGAKLAGIAEKRQVLCVTHLASIAAKADKHLLIEKSDDGERTFTRVKNLEPDERKKELARIISGDEEQLTVNIVAGKM